MKTKIVMAAILIIAAVVTSRAQINPTFGSVRGWNGACRVFIVDSTEGSRAEYIFDGPVIMQNELDMSPYNMSWPNPAPGTPPPQGTVDINALAAASKDAEDKFRVWNARISVNQRWDYDDVVSSAHYTCSLQKNAMLKFQIAIQDNTLTLAPELVIQDVLNCSGNRDGAPVLPRQDFRLMLQSFDMTSPIPATGGRHLFGKKTMVSGSQSMTIEWDFAPIE